MAIAHVAARDWPQEWPDLMEQLLRALGDAGCPARGEKERRPCMVDFSLEEWTEDQR